ncbi:trans-sulfuration enzyme family protein [Thalassiella azotivora]
MAVSGGRPPVATDAPLSPPVVLTSTYVGDGPVGAGERVYGRMANPTWEDCEAVLGALEGADGGASLFASGMAAVAAVVALVPVGGVVVAPSSAYNTTLTLLDEAQQQGRLAVRRVDVTDTEAVAAAARGAHLVWLESPTNPLLEVADLAGCARVARAAGAMVAVDNTFATPLVQRPLDLGADVVVHSVTKYLAGHSDVVLGATVTRSPDLRAALVRHRTVHGAVPGPFEAWLALRGMRTLHLRVERSQANAAELARRLVDHPAVARVRHPSLPDDPGHARAAAQMRGFGSVVGVECAGGARAADAVCSAVRLWVPATSLGGVESTLERRRRHPNEPDVVPESLVRLSVGVEDVEDLWADLDAALRSAGPRTGS